MTLFDYIKNKLFQDKNYGWVPCHKALPEKNNPHLYATEYLVTAINTDGKPFMTFLWFGFEQKGWFEDYTCTLPASLEITAWHPHIKPYHPNER